MTERLSSAVELADAFGRYLRSTDDWQRQSELWEQMTTLYEVHKAERAADAARRLGEL